ncbi:MAG: phospho-N-acetylmuramoyl-pentapeptide-transferase [Alphaproteobacteria bacterium]|jgi:phospho-N-acetylmuramoyl-pentapeptide-transferase|nr:phospho-N-acetylmuramoyl-pentapeptide-transferase [Alphaproteobacteria bacterium]MBT5827814.1 phospho-N-acetylmuramoyl-pentapeptide-transferase [Alphaproteobacteria bacterium]
MLYSIFEPLFSEHSFYNLFRYISFRSGGAFFTSLILSFIFAPKIIAFLKARQKFGQPIREDGPQTHIDNKQGTPTMGGIIIIFSMLFSTLIWTNLTNPYVWVVTFIVISFSLIGFVDDYLKLTKRNSKGVSGKKKLMLQLIFSFIAVFWLKSIAPDEFASKLYFPIFKNLVLDLGLFYIPFAMMVMVGSSNAVNLTDGLDGLATIPIIIASASFALICYLVGNVLFAGYLHLPYIEGAGEITIIASGIVGSLLGFLWFNAPPAKIFMGDTGSLSLGAILGSFSLISKNELTLAIIGGVFVLEALSVIIQVYSFKLTGKRVFRMAPIHHHFEQKGWPEATIVIRFWIISIILAIIGLATLKIR